MSEPSGAALLDGADEGLVVAGTNNHRLVSVGPDGEASWPFDIRDLLLPAPTPERGPVAVDIGPVELAGELELTATLPVPCGQKLDPSLGPPVHLAISSEDILLDSDLLLTGDELPANVQLTLGATEGRLDVLLRVGTCGEGAVCNLLERRWRVTVRRDAEGSRDSTWERAMPRGLRPRQI